MRLRVVLFVVAISFGTGACAGIVDDPVDLAGGAGDAAGETALDVSSDTLDVRPPLDGTDDVHADAPAEADAMVDPAPDTILPDVSTPEPDATEAAGDSADVPPTDLEASPEPLAEVVEAGEVEPDAACEPACDGRACGDDGCGGSCGDCPDEPCHAACVDGACVPANVTAEVCGNGVDDDCDGVDAFCAVPDGLADVGGRLVYAYEASQCTPGRACSAPAVAPWVGVTFAGAVEGCRAAGFRLCTADEWAEACAGPESSPYPYGDDYLPDVCNTQSGNVGATGSFPSCVSPWGLADLVGNAAEWVDGDGDAALAGGNAQSGAGARCQGVVAVSPQTSSGFVGFRCCVRWDDDIDGDGVVHSADPDDGDPQVFPGAPDPCTGKDEDGDGQTDEDHVAAGTTCGVGACAATGVATCHQGAIVDTCTPGLSAADDATCDGADDDCDGTTDDDVATHATTCGLGACAAVGQVACVDGVVSDSCTPGQPAADDASCDGVDDDCDGTSDEDVVPTISTCGVGACATTGVTSCAEGVPGDSCQPLEALGPDTTCDGLDDDCDGTSDEDYAPVGTTCGVGACLAAGETSCVGGQLLDSCQPGAAAASDPTCDQVDDDCDGLLDDDYVPEETTCGTGSCATTGQLACTPQGVHDTCVAGTGAPTDTTCDGVDDDCNGQADDGYVSVTSCFLPGACAAGNAASACTDGVETPCITGTPATDDADCDAIDDDCNGQADDGYVPVTSCFLPGACAAGNAASSCAGGVETPCATGTPAADDADCDAVDDDCDGTTDEDYVPVTSCFLPGACAAANAASTCSGGTETPCRTGAPAADDADCDAIDDDCNGQADDGYVPVTSCFKPGACAAGNAASTCVAGTEIPCRTGTPTADDADCDAIDDDCNGVVDDAYVPVTSCFKPGACAAGNAASTCVGGLETACKTGTPDATDADCDAVDDDCDGENDEDYVGLPIECGVGACTNTGAKACVNGQVINACTALAPEAETCNGVDDDCDGLTDADDDVMRPGHPEEVLWPVPCDLQQGVCAGSANPVRGCVNGLWLPCDASVYELWSPAYDEVDDATCDGLDNDCDGQADEDYAPVSSCFKPGACAAGNVASTCVGGLETACKTGTPAATDATCNGVDDDCNGQADEDYVPVTSCFKPGPCAADNAASSCVGGNETACRTGTPAATDATCNAVDDDCSGQTDEDYVPGTSCFLPGACAAGNVASSCEGGVLTACQTGNPAGNDADCDGADDDCNGLTDEDYVPVTSCFLPGACAAGNVASTCVGGLETACKTGTRAATDATCNGVDDDCSGQADEDYVPVSSCFKPGACAAGNAASTCAGGTETACRTGTPAANDATCDRVDNDCSGQVDEDYVPTTTYCGTGACFASGQMTCTALGLRDTCTPGWPAPEVCNGSDDDCDGLTDADDDYEDEYPNTVLQLEACEAQSGVCAGSYKAPGMCVDGYWLPCSTAQYAAHSSYYRVADTLCDGIDNDCSGQKDEDFVYSATACGIGACARTGNLTCTNGVPGDSCVAGSPVTEVCNTIDDDCDGLTDTADATSGPMVVAPCEKQAGVCAGSSHTASMCVGGAWQACTTTMYQAYSAYYKVSDTTCDGRDDDCDGVEDDNYVPTPAACYDGEGCYYDGEWICVNGVRVKECYLAAAAAGVPSFMQLPGQPICP